MKRLFSFLLLIGIIIFGCADPDDRVSGFEDETDTVAIQAASAMQIAQQAMEAAGVQIELSDLGELTELSEILPTPDQLNSMSADQINEMHTATISMYDLLEIVGETPINYSPSQQINELISQADLALIHVNLSYLNVLEAVRILTVVSGDLYKLAYSPETGYAFDLTESGESRLDSVKPSEYILQFSKDQRQAIVDALFLLTGAEVKVIELPDLVDIYGDKIKEQIRTLDRKDWQNALYHLDEVLDLATELSPDLANGLADFNVEIEKALADDILEQVKGWGFEISNYEKIKGQIEDLLAKGKN